LLNQADPAVEVELKESGELILIAAGEVHIDRCLTDLRESYCPGVKITVSKPILPFRETIVPFSGVDMRNEVIGDDNVQHARQVYLLGLAKVDRFFSLVNRIG
jgi:ribosome assembly protein 1